MRMLRANEVTKKCGFSRTTLWRLERQGRFPNRRRLSENIVAWSEEEIDAFLEEREVVQQKNAVNRDGDDS